MRSDYMLLAIVGIVALVALALPLLVVNTDHSASEQNLNGEARFRPPYSPPVENPSGGSLPNGGGSLGGGSGSDPGSCMTTAKWGSYHYGQAPVKAPNQPPAGSATSNFRCLFSNGQSAEEGRVVDGNWICSNEPVAGCRQGVWYQCDGSRAERKSTIEGKYCIYSGGQYKWAECNPRSIDGKEYCSDDGKWITCDSSTAGEIINNRICTKTGWLSCEYEPFSILVGSVSYTCEHFSWVKTCGEQGEEPYAQINGNGCCGDLEVCNDRCQQTCAESNTVTS